MTPAEIITGPLAEAESICAVESEQAVIGAMLYAPDECGEAVERLKVEHFFDPVHGAIWSALVDASRRMSRPDPSIIAEQLRDHPGFNDLGGVRFLADALNRANTYTLSAHVEMILDRACRRMIRHLGAYAVESAARTSGSSAETILAEIERGAAEIAREGVSAPIATAPIDAIDVIDSAWRGENLGASVGLEALDRVTGGIRREDVWIIGARTSVGKSVMALSLGRAIAEQRRGVLVFSLEMPRREVIARMVADLAFDRSRVNAPHGSTNVRYSDILKGRGTPDQYARARDAARRLQQLPVAISDVGGINIDEIRSQALRQVRTWERGGVTPGCVIIDHIGLVRPVRKTDNKAADTSDTVNELKALAKAVRAPVIALSQINRGPENRQDKRPTVADLNWSGAIEQIADFICLLYRESYYLERSPDRADQDAARLVENELDLLIQKNRSGPICNLRAFVDIACNAVRDDVGRNEHHHMRGDQDG